MQAGEKGGPTILRSRHLLESVMAVLALLWVDGCAMLTGIPDLDTPHGRVYAQGCGACHGTSHPRGHGVPDPRFRTMAAL
jgi:mono/diheme cytochrome c family protein